MTSYQTNDSLYQTPLSRLAADNPAAARRTARDNPAADEVQMSLGLARPTAQALRDLFDAGLLPPDVTNSAHGVTLRRMGVSLNEVVEEHEHDE